MKQPISMNPLLHVISLWLYGIMIVAAPPARPQYEPAAIESVAQAEERYHAIADAIAKVAYDPAEQPIPGTSRAFTAALMLSIAFHESSFRRDVDLGIGRQRLAKTGWNDYGRSWCLMQINLGKKNVQDTRPGHEKDWREESNSQTEEGWWGTELLADREKCFRAGLHVIRRTWGCHGGALADALTKYAGGKCYTAADEEKAKEDPDNRLFREIHLSRTASARRVSVGVKWARTKPSTWKDSEVIKALLEPPSPPPPAGQEPSAGTLGPAEMVRAVMAEAR